MPGARSTAQCSETVVASPRERPQGARIRRQAALPSCTPGGDYGGPPPVHRSATGVDLRTGRAGPSISAWRWSRTSHIVACRSSIRRGQETAGVLDPRPRPTGELPKLARGSTGCFRLKSPADLTRASPWGPQTWGDMLGHNLPLPAKITIEDASAIDPPEPNSARSLIWTRSTTTSSGLMQDTPRCARRERRRLPPYWDES